MTDPTVDITFELPDELAWQPETAEVAALLRARTVDEFGNELGIFDTRTRPTGDEVAELIRLSVGNLAARVGGEVPEDFWLDARRVAALQAASLVEASYFPNQLDSDRSAYRQYQAMYLNEVEMLTRRIRGGAGAGIGSLPVTTVVAQSSALLTDTDLLP